LLLIILVNHTVKELTTDFNWKRDRLFNKDGCQAILDICEENPLATVVFVDRKPKSKWRPLPLDTVVCDLFHYLNLFDVEINIVGNGKKYIT